MTIGIIYLGEGILSFAIFNNLFTILLINILNNIITPPPSSPQKKQQPKTSQSNPRHAKKKIFRYIFVFTF